MIDLHTHILPGLDDGAPTLADSLAMARAAEAGGVKTAVATPHIREDHPFALDLIPARVDDLNQALARERIELEVVGGGELAITKVADLDNAELRLVSLGSGAYILVESPYSDVTELLERTLSDLQERGFRPILAHPERAPAFLGNPGRLAALVERGVLCSVTAASIEGQFGQPVGRFARRLVRDGLVHNIASDAHDDQLRPPLRQSALEDGLPALRARARWLTREVPAAILDGAELPPPPQLRSRRSLFRRD